MEDQDPTVLEQLSSLRTMLSTHIDNTNQMKRRLRKAGYILIGIAVVLFYADFIYQQNQSIKYHAFNIGCMSQHNSAEYCIVMAQKYSGKD